MCCNAWLGVRKCVAPCRVAVNKSRERGDADFFLETNLKNYPFQLIEVQEPGRRRGAEYKALAAGKLKGFKYEPERGRTEGPHWIANAVAKKRGKKYAGSMDLNLLVYGNFSAHQLQHSDVVEAARIHVSAFASVWVVTSLWLGSIYVANGLGRIDGWCLIFTPEDYAADKAG